MKLQKRYLWFALAVSLLAACAVPVWSIYEVGFWETFSSLDNIGILLFLGIAVVLYMFVFLWILWALAWICIWTVYLPVIVVRKTMKAKQGRT